MKNFGLEFKNKFEKLVRANLIIYFLKYDQKYFSLWALKPFLYAALFRFVLTMASTATYSLAYKKGC